MSCFIWLLNTGLTVFVIEQVVAWLETLKTHFLAIKLKYFDRQYKHCAEHLPFARVQLSRMMRTVPT